VIETELGMLNTSLDNMIEQMRGQTIFKAEHIEGDSDADEQVRLTLGNGVVVTFGTSEWLNVDFQLPKGAAQ
jgi:hypothetical protein